jgi:hypothetical protein
VYWKSERLSRAQAQPDAIADGAAGAAATT